MTMVYRSFHLRVDRHKVRQEAGLRQRTGPSAPGGEGGAPCPRDVSRSVPSSGRMAARLHNVHNELRRPRPRNTLCPPRGRPFSAPRCTMRPSLFVIALLTLTTSVATPFATPASAQGYYGQPYSPGYRGEVPRARIWLDDNRDLYRRGDRLRILFSTSEDAYVAVIHVNPDGYLDFLYPESPLDRDYVRGGEVYSLPRRGFGGELVRGSNGVGYLYIIASPVPLDYGYFHGRGGYGWDWSYAGRQVY